MWWSYERENIKKSFYLRHRIKCKKLKISDITWKDVSNLKKQENM